MKKDELIDVLENERENFMDILEGLSEEALHESKVVGDWSVKDVIAHLSAWEAELVKLLWQAQQGQQPSSAHFSKTSVDELNASWYEEMRTRPLDRVLADFQAVRKQTSRRVSAFTDRDLNDVQRYAWLRGHPLWEWIAEDSFKHEAEHGAQIKEWRLRQGL